MYHASGILYIYIYIKRFTCIQNVVRIFEIIIYEIYIIFVFNISILKIRLQIMNVYVIFKALSGR